MEIRNPQGKLVKRTPLGFMASREVSPTKTLSAMENLELMRKAHCNPVGHEGAARCKSCTKVYDPLISQFAQEQVARAERATEMRAVLGMAANYHRGGFRKSTGEKIAQALKLVPE